MAPLTSARVVCFFGGRAAGPLRVCSRNVITEVVAAAFGSRRAEKCAASVFPSSQKNKTRCFWAPLSKNSRPSPAQRHTPIDRAHHALHTHLDTSTRARVYSQASLPRSRSLHPRTHSERARASPLPLPQSRARPDCCVTSSGSAPSPCVATCAGAAAERGREAAHTHTHSPAVGRSAPPKL